MSTAISFGVFADAHYADRVYADRYCKDSADKLSQAVATFNEQHVPFLVDLGDRTDAWSTAETEKAGAAGVNELLSAFNGECYHVLGNHDLASLTKHEFLAMHVSRYRQPYYSFDAGEFHFIVLDANCLEDGSDFAAGNFSWDLCWVSESQLAWLVKDLESAGSRKCVVFLHENLDFRLWEGNLDPHVVQNHEQIKDILQRYGNVTAVFQGHCHTGRYSHSGGIHYITISAMVVGPGPSNNSYAIVRLRGDGSIEVEGYGKQISLSLEAALFFGKE